MSPQEMTLLTTVLQHLGTMPIGTLLIVLLVMPWGVLLIYTWLIRGIIDKMRAQFQEETREARERFEAVVRMYETNVALVKSYERLANEQQDLIISNTTTMQRLSDRMDK